MTLPIPTADMRIRSDTGAYIGPIVKMTAGDLLMDGAGIYKNGADIASAANLHLEDATGDFVDVTGTTTVTALGTLPAGAFRTLRFTGALTFTHNATSLILPTGANLTTANGDVAFMRSLGSGNWVCLDYVRKNGTPLANFFDQSLNTDDAVEFSSVAAEAFMQDRSAEALATSGTIAVTMFAYIDRVFTITPAGDITLNATGGGACGSATFIITTSGTSSWNITFGTNFKSQGVLATGTVDAKVFSVSFVCKDGTTWVEESRTSGM